MHGMAMISAAALRPAVEAAIDDAVEAIPPLWPLASSVAVNPFLGQGGERLEMAAARLARAAGVSITMPRSWYARRLTDGLISGEDLTTALAASDWRGKTGDIAQLKAALVRPAAKPQAIPVIAELAAAVSGIDWPGIIAERIGHWAAGYFDNGQALWRAGHDDGAYRSWRETATHDLTPEILGLSDFARTVVRAPETPRAVIAQAVATLEVDDAALNSVFTSLLTTLGGWAQYARCQRFEAELAGSSDDTAVELLAIRMLWEEALFTRYRTSIAAGWAEARAAHAVPMIPSDDHYIDAVLQHAAELGAQRDLAARLAGDVTTACAPDIQAAFCIDVRSEVFRRALEAADPRVQTLGFAGFFGLATAHRRFASDVVERRLPVLLNPGIGSVAGGAEAAAADQLRRARARAARAWGRFKLAAVSSFAFVEAAGPAYLVKLVHDALGRAAPAPAEPMPRFDPPLPLEASIDVGEAILRAMSLTTGFAHLVMIAGHGARLTNNPHASGLQCGACGGYSGEVNARLLVALLNDPQVRSGLHQRGIAIPETTLFVGALHDTTSDEITLYDQDLGPAGSKADIGQLRDMLDRASRMARAERAPRLPRAAGSSTIPKRAGDWAETRPEWGLAGARWFIAAPRARTLGRSLDGQSFLHDYDCRADTGFGVLELILTAPVVVASWISLQYYGSVVAPEVFGGGNKLLHNVTGGIGVVEGNGGTLRGGLPWQSVHDGSALRHDPLRLTVCIEAPRHAIDAILARHSHVRELFANGWLHLLLLDEYGKAAWRYVNGQQWQAVEPKIVG